MALETNVHFQITSASAFHSQTESPSDFNIDFQNNPNTAEILSVVPHQVSLLNLVPNIYARGNNLTVLHRNTVTGQILEIISVIVPDGHYNYLTLPAAIQTATLAAGITGWNIVFSATTGKVGIFNSTLAPVIPDTVYQIASLNDVQNNIHGKAGNISLNLFMGASLTTPTSIEYGLLTYLPNSFNLAGPVQVLVLSSHIAMGNSMGELGKASNYFCSVDLSTTPYGSWARTSTQDTRSLTVHYSEDRKLNNMDFALEDSWGNVIPLPPQALLILDLVAQKIRR